MIRDRTFQTKAAEPAIGQIEMNLFAQTALGANPVAVANNQHPDHQFRIDRGAAGVAVAICEMPAEFAKIKASVNAS